MTLGPAKGAPAGSSGPEEPSRLDRVGRRAVDEQAPRISAREPATELEFHAVWVVWVLAGASIVAILLPLSVLLLNGWPARSVDERGLTQLGQVLDVAILKVLLPLTTLILGYLFGSARRRGESG